ncbi:hypothetical protein [Streptomyces hoynatensis]|uniref:hypothetical protein n=1 Tax=Streptomyces hoynatensis TaxID=1141874 RepID=UPI001F4DAD7C|nr:hypothetical protein [Streptomyces hoynatensis]
MAQHAFAEGETGPPWRLAAEVRVALVLGCSGSTAALRGSLASGAADAFSDIDVEWIVPDARFASCLSRAPEVLAAVRPVASVRVDPEFAHSDRRRLLYVRFAEVPLFWRLDLSVRAASVASDPDYDVGNPAARAAEGEWSRPASALANAVGVVKAVARGRPEEARALLDRGLARIGEPGTAGGAWPAEIARLARAAVRREPGLASFAAEVESLAFRLLGSGTPVTPPLPAGSAPLPPPAAPPAGP